MRSDNEVGDVTRRRQKEACTLSGRKEVMAPVSALMEMPTATDVQSRPIHLALSAAAALLALF